MRYWYHRIDWCAARRVDLEGEEGPSARRGAHESEAAQERRALAADRAEHAGPRYVPDGVNGGVEP